ncbi:MAG: alpha/beta hydrolase [Pyrinomonadaceae bacterium]
MLLLAVCGVVGVIIYSVAHPPQRAYLVTPDRFKEISSPGFKATDETWTNADGTRSRGWLLRGAEGAPAVILLHRYGADRSWLFNLGVKLNEATNFTVLWPDLRGHGQNPPVARTTFGTREADDALAAINFLRTLKSTQGRTLIGEPVGMYGVEIGAYASLRAAAREKQVRALVLDSVPASPDDLLRAAVKERVGFDNALLRLLTRAGARIYLIGSYQNISSCETAAALTDRHVLLLTGEGAGLLYNSTTQLAQCFPNTNTLEIKSDLPATGYNIPFAPAEQGEAYDRRVIDFFDKALRSDK